MIRLAFLLLISLQAFAMDPLTEQRYCGPPKRSASGEIIRRADVLAAFKRAHPCPSTGRTTGACLGWSMDHVIPLACGGCDAVSNLQWLPLSIKICADPHCKDRFERKIYCDSPQIVK